MQCLLAEPVRSYVGIGGPVAGQRDRGSQRRCPTSSTQVTLFRRAWAASMGGMTSHGAERSAPSDAEHGIGLDARRKLIRQGKLSRAPRTALVYGADVHLWEDANALDCDPRVEPKANAAHDAHRPPICQGVPVDRAAREGNWCRPIHDGALASGSRRKKVRRRRRMDAASALGRAGRCDLAGISADGGPAVLRPRQQAKSSCNARP